MRQKHWTIWLMLAVGLTGCKSGGLTPSLSNPLAFLMPKKSSEPEKPSSVATPTPPKAGYSSADDRSVAQAKSGLSPSGQSGTTSPAAGNASDFGPSSAGSSGTAGSSSRTRYGGNMAYGTSGDRSSPSGSLSNTPYGSPPLGKNESASSGSRYGIAPQVGRYDVGPAYSDNPPLSASRTNAAGYTGSGYTGYGYTGSSGRDYGSAGASTERYGAYSGASYSAPNWRSWGSSSPETSAGDPLARPDGYERTSSWASRADQQSPSSRSGSYGGAWDDRPGAGTSSGSGAWARPGDSTTSFSGSSRTGGGYPGYGGYSSGRSTEPTPGSSSTGSNNPYFSEPSRSSWQDGPADSRRTSPPSSENWPTGATGTRTGGASLGGSGNASWGGSSSRTSSAGDTGYRPGDTGYRPGDTGYRPGDTGYRPGDTGYRPGDTGYRPGQTGYNPPNTPPYQMPGNSQGGSSPSSGGEYRPGSTRSYTPGQPL